ncbi:MAG: hypothetical protein H6686_10180 [Fibrobacteria bacterium]|nr:hypothetical protein [Fibrobacteria bacterium]
MMILSNILLGALLASSPLISPVEEVWGRATRLASLGRHGAADTLARSQTWSRAPEGLVLRATIALGEFADLHHPERVARARVLLDQAQADLETDTTRRGRWLMMLARSQESYLLSLQGKEFLATLEGRKSASIAKELLEEDPSDPDVQGVLGGYYFWKAQVLGPLRTVMGGDTRAEGLRLTREAISAGSPLREVWRTSLLWIRFERREYGAALKLVRQALDDCPGNRIYRQAEGDILFRLGKYDSALETYRASWNEYAGLEEIPVNRQAAAGNLARIHFAAGRQDSATAWLDTLDAPRYRNTVPWLPPSLVRELAPVRKALGR